jgi:hypothetical protein
MADEGSPERPATGGNDEAAKGDLPEIDFSTFAVSLSTTVLYNLGLVEDRTTGKRGELNLAAARNTIDILEMLKRRTRGNLEDAEARLLDSLLFELRMRYVEVSKG